MSSPITTHALDTHLGCPAAQLSVTLECRDANGAFTLLARGRTGADGRLVDLLPDEPPLAGGLYRLTFETGAYFAARGLRALYPSVTVVFTAAAGERYHLPLYVGLHACSTYRGS